MWRARVVTELDELEALEPEWRTVFDASSDRSPFLSYDWVRTWWAHFGGGDELRVITVRRSGELVAIAPMLSHRFGFGPVGGQLLVGIGQETADYGGFLLGEDPGESGQTVLDTVTDLADGIGMIKLTRLRPDGATLAAVQRWVRSPDNRSRRFELRCAHEESYPYRRLGDPAHPLARAMKRNDVRRRLRRLAEGHDVVFDPNTTGRASERLGSFLRLHDLRWEARADRPSGLFTSARGRAFIADVAERFDALGWLRISFVRVDGTPIAARFGIQLGDTYLGLKSGWDPAYATFAPGHLIVGLLLEHLEASGVREFDFMRGAGSHKDRWATGDRSVGYWHLRRGGLRGRAADVSARLVSRRRYRSFGA
ncbi:MULTISPECIES: GNAT family N-acetyltransferase [unclassified Blastococcus]